MDVAVSNVDDLIIVKIAECRMQGNIKKSKKKKEKSKTTPTPALTEEQLMERIKNSTPKQ